MPLTYKERQRILEEYGGDLTSLELPDPLKQLGWGGTGLTTWLPIFMVILEYKFERLNSLLPSAATALGTSFNNLVSGLSATNVQEAIDEIVLGQPQTSVTITNADNPFEVLNNHKIIKCDTTSGVVNVYLPESDDFIDKELRIYNISGNNNIEIYPKPSDSIISDSGTVSHLTLNGLYSGVRLFGLVSKKWIIEDGRQINL